MSVLNLDGNVYEIINMPRDGSCLFHSITYGLYGHTHFTQDTRWQIVSHIVEKWDDYKYFTADEFGDPFPSAVVYEEEMLKPGTYGGVAEILAATILFDVSINVYINGTTRRDLMHGTSANVILLRFSGPADSGHYDVYEPIRTSTPLANTPWGDSISSVPPPPVVANNEDLCIKGCIYKLLTMPNDAQSLFNCIALYIYGSTLFSSEVRVEIVDHVVARWDSFKDSAVNQSGLPFISSTEYSEYMSDLKTHGDTTEVVAASEIFGVEFHIYTAGIEHQNLRSDEDGRVAILKMSGNSHDLHFDIYQPESDMLPPPAGCISRRVRTRVNKRATRNSNRQSHELTRAIRDISSIQPPNWKKKANSALNYDPRIDYAGDATVNIGGMTHACEWCDALKWKGEPPGMCCASGKVQLPALKPPPEPLLSLITDNHPSSATFLRQIRKYNACFQMTSFGGKVVTMPGFNPTFKIEGQVCHLIGSLLPTANKSAEYLQIYFVGNDEREADIRSNIVNNDINKTIVRQLQDMLHSCNPYIRDLKTAMQKAPISSEYQVVIHADRKPSNQHPGRYNAPKTNEVALVMVGEQHTKRDIIIESHNQQLRRISETHRSYDALQYPLLFPYGEDGYSISIPQVDPISGSLRSKTVSAADFYAYRCMVRKNSTNYLLYCCALLQQFLVDELACIIAERLLFIRLNQDKLRAENYIHLMDSVTKSDALPDLNNIGKMVILPSSFTGSPRFYHEKIQDAITYVRVFGRPHLFITLTCNPKDESVLKELLNGQTPQDRPDLVARVFREKVKKFIHLIKKDEIFGPVSAYVMSVEWQKRGLPHIHFLLWLLFGILPNDMDRCISAEIPDPSDVELRKIVESTMIHGPCGKFNPNSPCMEKNKCKKNYPRALIANTKTGEDGYPLYRRRSPADGGHTINLKGFIIDNSWVVPYNPVLSRTFGCHCNVEYCKSVKAIKYVCKYVMKGSDMAAFALEKDDREETKMYENGRYICSSEAAWRIFGFPIHEHFPTVVQLAVHLENGQRVLFDPNKPDALQSKLTNSAPTTLTAFFKLCQLDDFARTLLYSEVPNYYTYNKGAFSRRKRGTKVPNWPGVVKDEALGRIYTVHPNQSECYHLRLLLNVVRGPTSFLALRTVNGIPHATYKSACLALGILEDDKNWDATLEESAAGDNPKRMRDLFVTLIVFCNVADLSKLWMKYRLDLSEDIRRSMQMQVAHATAIDDDDVFNQCLILIEDEVQRIGGCTLPSYGLPSPNRARGPVPNRELLRELDYDRDELKDTVTRSEATMTQEQREVYEKVMADISNEGGSVFFLDAPGGTGKTFLINTMLAKVRQDGGIAIAVASSGIAATLLQGGRTAHSAFKLPLDLFQVPNPVGNISKQSHMAEVLRLAKFIVWDEATMANKVLVEALGRTLQDIRGNTLPMGGLTLLLSGDFRQTLPVIRNGTRADEVLACIKSSDTIWPIVVHLRLSTNMRVRLGALNSDAAAFSKQLLDIGNGAIPNVNGEIKLPDGLGTFVKSKEELMGKVYPNAHNIGTASDDWLCERAILAPRNDEVAEINDLLFDKFLAQQQTYTSVNTVMEADDATHYPVEFLNSLTPSGVAPHNLRLKVGAPVMLLRNIRPPSLCNGTRLRVTTLRPHTVVARVISGKARGELATIPRIIFIPNDYPFQFRRLQLPLKLSFGMTITKSQGQSLKVVGLELEKPCFSHGQLYVGCSRVTSASGLYIHAADQKTQNVVYPEVLR